LFQIGILFGGRSTEHSVSLRSGTYIYNTLDREKFKVKPILISKEGDWLYSQKWNSDWVIPDSILSHATSEEFSDLVYQEFQTKISPTANKPWTDPSCGGCDLYVIGLHGGEGEDGRIQAFLDTVGIPYTGSAVLASSLAMDKFRSNLIFESQGIPVAKNIDITREQFLFHYELNRPGQSWAEINGSHCLNFPVFSKPTTGGSSVGTFRSDSAMEWEEKIFEVFKTEERMLVQENIQGREVSCGILERPSARGWKPFALSPTEIIPETNFFDYEAKYIPGKSREVTPPNMDTEWIRKIQEYSLLAHQSLGCRGYSRSDFIVSEQGIPWILETNTLPGMTGTSLIPQQAAVGGLSMKKVFTWLIQLGLERKGIQWPWEEY
jgi:D-alanine-D-alanine ligase